MKCRRNASWLVALAIGWLVGPFVQAESCVQDLVGDDPAAMTVLTNDYIKVSLDGCLAMDFDTALDILQRPDLLDEAQRAYAELLPEGETAEFQVQRMTTNRFYYINRKQQRADVAELYRGQSSQDLLEMVFHSRGKRFFGPFQALIHIRTKRTGSENVDYTVDVYAYPERAAPRFFSRHLRLLERVFRSKSRDVRRMLTGICKHLYTDD